MPKIKNIFSIGVQDKDTNKAFVRNGRTRHVENIRFHTNDGDDGVGKSIKGTQVVSDETGGNSDFKCVTALFNEDKDVIYYLLATSTGVISRVIEYDIVGGGSTIVLDDSNAVLKFNKEGYITGINEIDGKLLWSEWGNNPRRIDVERAKTYGLNGFTEDDIMVLVKPPLQKLRLTLQTTQSPTQQENNIEERMLYFSYRFRYLDGEYSALAPFSEPAFFPKNFNYDFAQQMNPSMINAFNQVLIEFYTGSDRVTEIQLVYRESESTAVYIIDDFVKSKLGYADDDIQSFEFNNQKAKGVLPKDVLPKYFDNVPRSSLAQTMIDGRTIYAHYLEQYDIVDISDTPIELDYDVEGIYEDNFDVVLEDDYDEDGNIIGQIPVNKPTEMPLRSVKSNRDYEIGIVYTDGHGRATTVLVGKNNTLYIPNAQSITGNTIRVTLRHNPPKWATHYRFFITQAKKGYDMILPTLFYEDGRYRWVKLEGADKDKVKEGDYLIVKSDSQEVIENLVKVKVLEVSEQEQNFLQAEDVTDSITERSGLYFKIKPEGFRLDFDDLENFEISTYDNTRNAYNDPVRTIAPYIGYAHFYGDQLDDMTSNQGGGYTGSNNERNRYLIQIDGLLAVNGHDTFRWSDDNGATFQEEDVEIIPNVPYALNNGVEITFANDTGHSLNDEWNINARSTWSRFNSSRAYGFFRTTSSHGETLQDLEDEVIEAGARILIEYNEYGRGSDYFLIDTISSSRYDNIEEWYHKENILSQITAQTTLTSGDIHFMRGNLRRTDNATEISQDNVEGTMTMCIRSAEHGTAASRVKVRARTEIIQNDGDGLIIFETEPKDQNPEIFYEIGRTYKIEGGFHSAQTDDYETEINEFPTDQSQTAVLPLQVTLDFFNCFSYGNAVETYKIRDEFVRKGLDVGVRVLANSIEEYKEVVRTANCTWSDVYNDETNFNGLGSFNLSLANFVRLDKESGSIQKLHNANKSLLVCQEDGLGLIPYNRNITQTADGGEVVSVSTNILDERSYRPYAGIHGIGTNPESFIAIGNRKYFADKPRGNWIRLSIDGVTTINENLYEREFSDLMEANKANFLVAGYDPKHQEVLLSIPSTSGVLAFKEGVKGFPLNFTYEPDFMIHANNELYSWKDGVMYKHEASAVSNNYYGVKYPSKIKFFMNQEFGVEKVWNAMGIESSHAWDVNVKTDLTERAIPQDHFEKLEDHFFAPIMGNTNSNASANSTFGIGSYAIVGGEIITDIIPDGLSVGDFVSSKTLLFPPSEVIDIQSDRIVLSDPLDTVVSFLKYAKNQGIDGSSIRGDILEVEMTNDTEDELTIRAVTAEVATSPYS